MTINESAVNVVAETLKVKHSAIEIIRRTGGMTNVNYIARVEGKRYVVRIPGKGTDELVDRQTEKQNLVFASDLGINPAFAYFNAATGVKITREIDEATTLTDELVRDPMIMQLVADVFHNLHYSGYLMENRFNLKQLIDHYEHLIQATNPFLFERCTEMKEQVMDLIAVHESFHIPEVPCHMDTGCFNFILGDAGKLYLIDWEYSGMFDPLWDIAAFLQESAFTPEEENVFLQRYFEREATYAELQRVQLHKIFQDYLWSLWGAYKEISGDDNGDYVTERLGRIKSNIAIYQTTYAEGEVG